MPIQYRGVSGMGNINSLSDYDKIKSSVVLWFIRTQWSDIETSFGVYDFSSIDDIKDIVYPDDKYMIIQINVAPANPPTSTTPDFYFASPYNVPKVYTDRGQYFPYYFNSTFEDAKNDMLAAVRAHIKNTWTSGEKAKLIAIQSAEFSTGDEYPYKGNIVSVTIDGVLQPKPSLYNITDDDADNYKRTSVWLQFYASIATDLPLSNMMMNPSNTATNWAWALANIPNSGLKTGEPTHNYNNVGEFYFAQRVNALTNVLPNGFVRGEFEQTDELSWFQQSPKQNTFNLLMSYITHGGTSMNIAINTFKNIIDIDEPNDFWMFDFANNYMGIRNATESVRAFICFRDIIDGTDLARFPENEFGTVIPVSQLATYNSRYLVIYNSTDSQEVKNERYVNLMLQYFNDARRVAMQVALPNHVLLPLSDDQDHDAYNNDFIVYGLTGGNYGKFMTQYSPSTTSLGYNRIGSVLQEHGRTCRVPNPELFVSIDVNIVNNSGFVVSVDVWYYDESSRSWSYNYWNGTTKTALTITNTGTNEWVKHTFSISDFYGGSNLENSADWTLKTESGSGTKFDLVEFTRISAAPPPDDPTVGILGVYRLGNTLATICAQSTTSLYTIGNFAIGKTLYTDADCTVILPTPYAYIVDTGTGFIYHLYNSIVGSLASGICGGGVYLSTYKAGNDIDTVCLSETSINIYSSVPFGIGVFLFTDLNLMTAFTGYTYIVNPINYYIYIVDSATGQILSQTINNCLPTPPTPNRYISPEVSGFTIEAAPFIKDCGCEDDDNFSQYINQNVCPD